MLTPPDAGPSYAKFMDEYSLKHAEGFHVEAQEVEGAHVDIPVSAPAPADNISTAHDLFRIFKCLFADLILSFQDRDYSRSLFQTMSHEQAFDVIAIELGFMYDLLYTKTTVIHTPWGLGRRVITTFLTSLVLVIFCFSDKKKFSKVDLSITFLLLIVAILLEIYAAFALLLSDRSSLWFNKLKNGPILEATIKRLEPVFKLPKWSNSMGQYSVTRLCLKEKHGLIYKIPSLLHMDKIWEEHWYKTYKQVRGDLKSLLFEHVKKNCEEFKKESTGDKDIDQFNWIRRALKKYKQESLDWSIEAEFDKSILIWHIATTLCYYDQSQDSSAGNSQGRSAANNANYPKLSKLLSRYMIYLLVAYPSLLPVGIGLIRFRDTCSEATNFFEERMSIYCSDNTDSCTTIKNKRIRACKMLLKVKTDVPPIKVKGDRSKSVLFDACKLATQLNESIDDKEKWMMITDVWLEILTYAASQGRGSQHARRLKRGGELLTHVWFLMAHFGMTDQFQMSEGHATAKLIMK